MHHSLMAVAFGRHNVPIVSMTSGRTLILQTPVDLRPQFQRVFFWSNRSTRAEQDDSLRSVVSNFICQKIFVKSSRVLDPIVVFLEFHHFTGQSHNILVSNWNILGPHPRILYIYNFIFWELTLSITLPFSSSKITQGVVTKDRTLP